MKKLSFIVILIFSVTLTFAQQGEGVFSAAYIKSPDGSSFYEGTMVNYKNSLPKVWKGGGEIIKSVTPLAETYIESNIYAGKVIISNREPKEGETVVITITPLQYDHASEWPDVWFDLAFAPELHNYSLVEGSDSKVNVRWAPENSILNFSAKEAGSFSFKYKIFCGLPEVSYYILFKFN